MSRHSVVLLVPPDRLTGITTANILASYGIEVVTTGNLAEAHRLLHANQRIDVLIIDTDLAQGDDGLSLAKNARASDPDLKVIYTSRMPFRLRDADKVCGAPCVRTPYRPHQPVGVISQLTRRPAAEEAEVYAA
jgi:CheY-like chemotaxis protein